MGQILIRQAKSEDLPTLLIFEQNLIKAERPFDPTLLEDQVFNYYDIGKMIEGDETEVVVAEINGRLVASGHARIRTGNAYNQFQEYAFLGFMYTEPDQRGKGINQLIINKLIAWANARGLKEIRLQVYSDNMPAIRAYEKIGFSKILTEMRLTGPNKTQLTDFQQD